MNSANFEIGADISLSNEAKIDISNYLKNVLSKARQCNCSHSVKEVTGSPATIQNIDKLCQIYKKEKICIFTGAGVSFTESIYYESPGWWDLLGEIYTQISPTLSGEKCALKFDKLRKKYYQPWKMASYLQRKTGSEKFKEILSHIFYHRTQKTGQKLRPIGGDVDKRLPIDYLHHASTLNAVIAFCSKLRAIRKHPCYEKNEEVQAVLTLNYDCFLEAGATQKYNAGRFKPKLSLEPIKRKEQLPVYHIHGYIPYGGRKTKKPLVLTEQSYQNAYKKNGNARLIITQLLSNFSALFIGISFNDELLLQCLEEIAKQKDAKNHFAILIEGTDQNLLNRLESAKMLPILCRSFQHIPAILGLIYMNQLPKNPEVKIEAEINHKIKMVGHISLSKQEYWDLLLSNKR